MSVKVRHKRSGRVATVTDVLGRAFVRMGSHSYVVAETQAESQPAPEPAASDDAAEAPKAKRTYRRKDMRPE